MIATSAHLQLRQLESINANVVWQESSFFEELKASSPFFIMAGPNVVESEEHCLKLARQIKSVTDALGLKLVFKASFDKANRTSATSFRGPGLDEGLRSLPIRSHSGHQTLGMH